MQVCVSGMTVAPLTLCHEVMRGKCPCKKYAALVESQGTRQKNARKLALAFGLIASISESLKLRL